MVTNLFQIINYTLILVALGFLFWYLWTIFSGSSYKPVVWQYADKTGRIPASLKRIERNYPDKVRFFSIWTLLEKIKEEQIEGALAELGVYKGESALIIHHTCPDKKLYLFDTFEGFPGEDLLPEKGEAATYTTKNFADTSVEMIRRLFAGSDHVIVRKGYFPETATGLEDETFSFVNIDADLYLPIKSGLEFFYPRLQPGGIILIHDYNYKWPGAMKAVDDFVSTIPESAVLLPDMDCSVIIRKNRK